MLYAALWRALPGPLAVRVLLAPVLVAAVVARLLPVGLPADRAAAAVQRQHRRPHRAACAHAPRPGAPMTQEHPMTRILVVDNYDSFVFTIVGYLAAARRRVRRRAQRRGRARRRRRFDGVLVSPGPGTPEEAGVSMAMIEACAERVQPMLGVCLGHQALGVVLGADGRPRAGAAARQDLPRAPRRHRRARGAAVPVHGDPLPLADDRPARRVPDDAGRQRAHRVRRSSWRSGTASCRCTACSSTPSRC